MNVTDSFLNPGIAVAFWIIAPLLLVTVIATIIGARAMYNDSWASWPIPVFIVTGLAVAAAIVFACSLIPWDAKYWTWYVIEAHVTDVSNNFADGSGDVTTGTYVLTLDGVGFPVVSYDDRASRIEGQDVTLLCSRSWVDWGNSADQWSCSIKEY